MIWHQKYRAAKSGLQEGSPFIWPLGYNPRPSATFGEKAITEPPLRSHQRGDGICAVGAQLVAGSKPCSHRQPKPGPSVLSIQRPCAWQRVAEH